MKILIPAFICLFLAIPCQAEIITVDDDDPADFNNIQAAIYDANNGDEIIVADGIYTGNGNRDIDFNGLDITVRSENGPTNCIIDCNATLGELHRAFTFNFGEGPNSIVKGFTIINGYALNGGAIHCDGSSPTVSHCIIAYNNADANGGGIYCNAGSPTVNNCIIFGNSADANEGGGGIYCDAASPAIINCTVTGNSTNGSAGGGISCVNGSNPMIRNSIFWADSPNEISLQGGSSASISYCDVQGGASGVSNIDTDPLFIYTYPFFLEFPPSLISQWRFDEGEGTTAYDSVGDNDGTVYGATWTTGKIYGALSFDGSYDYVAVGDKESLELQSFTLTFWSQNDHPEEDLQGGIAKGKVFGSVDQFSYKFQFRPNSAQAMITNTNNQVFYALAPFYDSNWHMWTMTAGDGILSIYKDSVIQDSAPYTGPIDYTKNFNNFAIGAYIDGKYAFDGIIDDVRIYDRALSDGEVQQLYLGQLFPGGLYPLSPCIDAGDPNYVQEPNEKDIDGNPRVVVDVIDMGAHESQPVIELSALEFEFIYDEGGPNPQDQILTIRNAGGTTLNWTISYDCNWLEVDPNSGSSEGEPNEVTLSVDTTGLEYGTYECDMNVSDPNAENSPQIVTVMLNPGCFPSDHDDYAQWIKAGKPDCWCDPKQCYGDADLMGEVTKAGSWQVSSTDLSLLSDGWQRPDGQDAGVYTWEQWRCADFDHVEEVTKSGTWRVGFEDLNILSWNWQDDNHINPPDPNYGPLNRSDCVTRGH